MNRLSHLKNVSVDRSGTRSRCTARDEAKQAKRAMYTVSLEDFLTLGIDIF